MAAFASIIISTFNRYCWTPIIIENTLQLREAKEIALAQLIVQRALLEMITKQPVDLIAPLIQ